jgi:NAD(P)-dependent dehydrogenase (short-subunit alcohol dehydrogenase family)
MLADGKGGKVINIASLLSFQGGIRIPSYTASKSGLAGLTRLLACEWAGKGINVNAIAPGYFVTNNTEALRADPEAQRGDPRPHPGRALGQAAGDRRWPCSSPRCRRLYPWRRPAGRRRLARALRKSTHGPQERALRP